MYCFIDVFAIILLAALVLQDFSQRAISWFLLPLLFSALFIKSLSSSSVSIIAYDFLKNTAFLSVQFFLVAVYFVLKERKIKSIINSKIGLGDVLFLLVLAIAFSPINFIVFYLLSLLLTLVGLLIYYLVYRRFECQIPLAGSIAILLIICIFSQYFFFHLDFRRELILNYFFLSP